MSPRALAHPRLTPALILAWADAHRAATGAWPSADLTLIVGGLPGLRWEWVSEALGRGARGLPGGDSLARLLARERGKPHQQARPRLTGAKIGVGEGPSQALGFLAPHPRGSRRGPAG